MFELLKKELATSSQIGATLLIPKKAKVFILSASHLLVSTSLIFALVNLVLTPISLVVIPVDLLFHPSEPIVTLIDRLFIRADLIFTSNSLHENLPIPLIKSTHHRVIYGRSALSHFKARNAHMAQLVYRPYHIRFSHTFVLTTPQARSSTARCKPSILILLS